MLPLCDSKLAVRWPDSDIALPTSELPPAVNIGLQKERRDQIKGCTVRLAVGIERRLVADIEQALRMTFGWLSDQVLFFPG